jgi:5-methylcytosine-specific restriction endonuclease McrA
MVARLCCEAGCASVAEVRGRCASHARARRKANRSAFDSFYASKAWALARRKQLFQFPLCQFEEGGKACGRIADSVHHRIELTEGGAPRDPANLMSVCRRHHSLIHALRHTLARGQAATAPEGRASAQPSGPQRALAEATARPAVK